MCIHVKVLRSVEFHNCALPAHGTPGSAVLPEGEAITIHDITIHAITIQAMTI